MLRKKQAKATARCLLEVCGSKNRRSFEPNIKTSYSAPCEGPQITVSPENNGNDMYTQQRDSFCNNAGMQPGEELSNRARIRTVSVSGIAHDFN
jgi:hypothetical protein